MSSKKQSYRPQITRKRLYWARLESEYKKFRWFYFRIKEEEVEIEKIFAKEEFEKQLAIDDKLNKKNKDQNNYFN